MKDLLISGKRRGLNTLLRQFTTILDLENGRYKVRERLLGIFSWGKFEPPPEIEYILVFRQRFAKCESCSLGEFEENHTSFFQISLVHHKTRRIVLHETKKKEEAFKLAQTLAKKINKPILDSATNRRKSVWIYNK
jgi:hypothetical protein